LILCRSFFKVQEIRGFRCRKIVKWGYSGILGRHTKRFRKGRWQNLGSGEATRRRNLRLLKNRDVDDVACVWKKLGKEGGGKANCGPLKDRRQIQSLLGDGGKKGRVVSKRLGCMLWNGELRIGDSEFLGGYNQEGG